MLTIDEVANFPLFANLAVPELELLAKTSADIHLRAGEYAVHEGGTERALFAILSGKLEVVKLIDGVERTLGWRPAGSIFGEIPIAIGLPFYGGYRASEPSRIMRVEARQYFTIAAAAPEISLRVSELARERIGGMQGISAQAPKPLVTMVGERWDPACAEMRQFLSRNQITFDWIARDAGVSAGQWPGPLPGPDDCPMLRLADGRELRRPRLRELAEKLGLQTHARLAEYDTVIIGGDVIRTQTIILATGVKWRRLRIDGFDRLLGKGIYFGAARSEASGANGLDVYLIGAGNSAGQAAMHLASYARKVTLIVRGMSIEDSMSHYLIEQLRSKSNIAVLLGSEVHGVHGDTHLTAIDIRDKAKAVTRHECGGLFVFIGADAETEWLPPEIARDARGYILTGDDAVKAGRWSHNRDPYLLETSVPGVLACGDVRLSPVKRVASAVGEGSMAVSFVHQYLAREGKSQHRKS